MTLFTAKYHLLCVRLPVIKPCDVAGVVEFNIPLGNNAAPENLKKKNIIPTPMVVSHIAAD